MAWWKAGPTPRETQLASLEQAFPDAKKTLQGNACYYDLECLGFISLRVFLPPRFPDEKPVLQLMSGHLEHPWVNAHHQVAGHPSLQRWQSQVDFRTVLTEVIAELAVCLPSDVPSPEAAPIPAPVLATVAPPSYEAAATPSPIRATGQPPPPLPPRREAPPPPSQPQQQQQQQQRVRAAESSYVVPTPEVPTSFPELEALDLPSLEKLLDDEVAFHTHVNNLDAVRTMQELRADAMRANAATAAATQQVRPTLEKLRQETLTLEAQLSTRRADYEAKVARQCAADEATSSTAAILRALQAAAAEAEDASEREVKAFCRQEVEVREGFGDLFFSVRG